jgi:hypothetical protein
VRAKTPQNASIEELIQWYVAGVAAYEQALDAANSRAANRAHDEIAGAYRELRNRAEAPRLLPLLKSDNEPLRASVAAHALEFAPEHGEPVLLWIAARGGRGGFRAEMALKAWREGTLKFP